MNMAPAGGPHPAEPVLSPNVECCCHESKKPAWLIYAETRGGEIQIVINELEYVLVYRP